MVFEKYRDQMIKNIQEVVKIRSVIDTPVENGPFGKGNKQALEFVLNLCKDLGFEVCNLDGYCGYAQVGKGEEIFAIITHLDVVPEGEGWDYEPYEAKIVDGYLYGRGVWDDKGPAIISIYALKALMDSNFQFKKRIRLIFGCNEESGSQCVEHYLKKEGQISYGFTPDADFPVIFAEKDINHFKIKGKAINENNVKLLKFNAGVADNAVPGKATFILEDSENLEINIQKITNYLKENNIDYSYKINQNQVKIEVIGKSAHGSVPFEGINAASYALVALSKTNIKNYFVEMYAKYINTEYNGKSLNCFAHDQYGDIAVNVGIVNYENNYFEIVINSRLPFNYNTKKQIDSIKETLKNYPVEVILESESKGFHIPENSLLIQNLLRAYQEESNDYESKPICIAGGTYAREFKNCVGFGPSLPSSPVENMHGANERLKLSLLEPIFMIYYKAIAYLHDNITF